VNIIQEKRNQIIEIHTPSCGENPRSPLILFCEIIFKKDLQRDEKGDKRPGVGNGLTTFNTPEEAGNRATIK
jgi:hypothetical protein